MKIFKTLTLIAFSSLAILPLTSCSSFLSNHSSSSSSYARHSKKLSYQQYGSFCSDFDIGFGRTYDPSRHWKRNDSIISVPWLYRSAFIEGYDTEWKTVQAMQSSPYYKRGQAAAAKDHKSQLRYDAARYKNVVPLAHQNEFTHGYRIKLVSLIRDDFRAKAAACIKEFSKNTDKSTRKHKH